MKLTISLKRFITLALLVFLSLGLSACQNSTITTQLPSPDSVGNFSSYDELKTYLSSYYEKQSSTGQFLYRNSGLLYSDAAVNEGITATMSTGSAEVSTTEKSHSETNNQVDGVAESDTILTDGNYIYVTSNTHFYIIDAESLQIVFSYTYENGYLVGMYLYNNKVVVISSEYQYADTNDDTLEKNSYWYSYSYGLRVNVFDIADIEHVTISKSLYFDSSSLVDSRMIDGNLYLVLDNYEIYYGFTENHFVPEYKDSTICDETIQLSAQNIYYMPNDNDSFGYLLLVSLNVEDQEAANVKAYLGSSYQIYMSANNLYTIIYRYYYDEETLSYNQDTYILRFAVTDSGLEYQACGKISGSPLNQFSMDEYDGVFRIATTEYIWNYNTVTIQDASNTTSTVDSATVEANDTVINKVFLLDCTSIDSMTLLGQTANLGKPGERIYAVRYDNGIAYVVTFVNTDPLYKLDLSDPTNPVVVGELYEEGVSDYLHIINDSLLLGIGRQAETNVEGRTSFTGVKVSLYNTSGEVMESIATYFVEGVYSYSPVTYDSKAFVSYQPVGEDFMYVVIPIYEWSYNYESYSQSAYVFKVYLSGDLELVTKLTNYVEDSENPDYYGYDSIERTIIIENYIYTVSYSKIQMYDMNDNFSVQESTALEADYYIYFYGTGLAD
ncbi:MAG: beta-propeller domain-containing protein [Candidatus Izemoplasmatales bacterium]|nr:beta-propeller domain-containing protein [Candidatus Izemoplasmatales bacterium]